MNRGFVIMAQNTNSIDYVNCADVLSASIKKVMPDANITIVTTDMLPYGDLAPDSDWKLINDWQVYESSPYEYTIKLEADMYIPCNIDYWWDVLKKHDLVISTTIRNFHNNIHSELKGGPPYSSVVRFPQFSWILKFPFSILWCSSPNT